MLAIRQRGTYWHVRGVIKGAGKKKEHIAEHSSQCTTEGEARAYADGLEREIRARWDLNLPPPAPYVGKEIGRAIADFCTLHGGKISAGDLGRLTKLALGLSEKMLDQFSKADWERFCLDHLAGTAANTRARYQTTLRQVFRDAGQGAKFPDDIAHGAERVERVRWLQHETAERLIDAYGYVDPENGRRSAKSPHARGIARTLRYQGGRSSACRQIQRPLFDDKRGPNGSIFIEKSKNGLERWVPLHPRVREAWEPLLCEPRPTLIIDGRARDPLFLTDKRRPYRDPRKKGDGGNPFARAHNSACKRAGVDDFTPHDWRHHWATWNVKLGMDLRTLQTLGGWLDLNQVQRYAAVDADDAAEKIARVA